ncbi:MAG: hypothetical protein NTX03_09895 [Bacteroidetes bacterium]|nr:hypothetical protein [Bacteroidota bacterium]
MKPLNLNEENEEETNLPGYPPYRPSEDIYNVTQKVGNIDIENNQEASENGLDVPGADLDDDEEEIGNEDEENNFYSLGGDNHHDLEEDQGD